MPHARTDRPGLLYRWSRFVLVMLLVWLSLSWVITVGGTYYWFSIGDNNKVRMEYGRAVWSHGPGRANLGSRSGVDGGGSHTRWQLEVRETDAGFVAEIPLWMPGGAILLILLAMAGFRWSRRRRNETDSEDVFS